MKIGDIVYLAELTEWYKTLDHSDGIIEHPAGTPVRIIGDSGFRGWDIEFVETGVIMLECLGTKFVESWTK